MYNILSDISNGIQSRSFVKNFCAFSAFLSMIEQKNVKEAQKDPDWVLVMPRRAQPICIIQGLIHGAQTKGHNYYRHKMGVHKQVT